MSSPSLGGRSDALTRVDCFVGGFALGAIVLHDAAHVLAGRWYDVFWVCNLAALAIGPGVLARSPQLCITGLTWIIPGTIVWWLDTVLAGSNILPTSWGVHVGGSLAAIYGVRRAGYAKNTFWVTGALPLAAILGSRLALPAERNVNGAHAVPRGWSFLGESWWGFFGVATAICFVMVGLGLLLARAITVGRSARSDRG